jgi:hypothetical protein
VYVIDTSSDEVSVIEWLGQRHEHLLFCYGSFPDCQQNAGLG